MRREKSKWPPLRVKQCRTKGYTMLDLGGLVKT